MAFAWTLVGIIAVLVLWAVVIYNRLIKKKYLVEESWSGVETQLKRRADLVPNLVETVKGYAAHERQVFDAVTEARAKSLAATGVGARADAERSLTSAIGSLMAVAENYPDLKASQGFAALQSELAKVEDDIQLARRYYNATVRELNIAIQSFPSNLVAKAARYKTAAFFEIENAVDRQTPGVAFHPQTA